MKRKRKREKIKIKTKSIIFNSDTVLFYYLDYAAAIPTLIFTIIS